MADNIEMYSGNNRTIEVTLTDSDGAAFDLSGAVLYFNVKKNEGDAASLISKSSAVATEIAIVAPATGGVFEVFLLPADSASLNGEYYYDMTMVINLETFTLVKDRIKFNLPVK